MEITKDDLGKFFYILDYTFDDNEDYLQILRCELVKISKYESYELRGYNKNDIEKETKISVWLKFRDEYYTPNIEEVHRTIEEAAKQLEIRINEINTL